MSVLTFAKGALRTINAHAPLIMTGVAVAGVVSTGVLAAKAAYDSAEIIRDHEAKSNGLWIKAGPKERVQLTWHLYIPAIGTGLITVACIVGAQATNTKRQAALLSGFTIVESAFREYRDQVVETLGAAKDQKVIDEVARNRVADQPPSGEIVILSTGNVLCFDTFTSRYFESNVEALRKAMNDINLQCINEMYASQNDFYRKINIPPADVGETVGWTTDNPIELQFTSVLSPDNRPVLAVNYRTQPKSSFHKIW